MPGNFPIDPKYLPDHNDLHNIGPNDHHEKFTEHDHSNVDHKGLKGVPIVDDEKNDNAHIWSAYKLLQTFVKLSMENKPDGYAGLDKHGKIYRDVMINHNEIPGIGPNDHHPSFTSEDHNRIDHRGVPGVPIINDNALQGNIYIWSVDKLLRTFIKLSLRNRPNGVAGLDSSGKIPSSLLPSSSDNSSSGSGIVSARFQTNGYVKFANGFIIQWGYLQGSNQRSYVTVYYPISFPNAAVALGAVNVGMWWGRDDDAPPGCYLYKNYFKYTSGTIPNSNAYWLALGY